MQVETFEIEDATSEASEMANDSAALELIQTLGLQGQMKKTNMETVTRIPYQMLTQEARLVYKALFTHTARVENYSADTIPLRVLQVIAHAKSLNCFRYLEIWYPENARIDDPVLVGFVGPTDYQGDYHILARWGKALIDFETLKKEAIEVVRSERLDTCREVLEKCNMLLKTIPTMTTLKAINDRPTITFELRRKIKLFEIGWPHHRGGLVIHVDQLTLAVAK